MKRALGLAVLLLACASSAQTRKNRPTAYFPFNKSGGDICDFTADTTFFAGNWWCVKGDGTNATGAPVTLSATGTVTTENSLLFPAGLDRGPGPQQRMGTTSSRFQTGSTVAIPSGDISTCVLAYRDSLTGSIEPLAHDSTANHAWLTVEWGTGNTATAFIYNAAGPTSLTYGTGTVLPRAYHLFCLTYHRVADGTSRMTTYLDGAQANQSTTATTPRADVNRNWTLGGEDYGTFALNGAVRGGFMTEVELTAAQIAQIARHVTGGRGFLAQLDLANRQTAYETSISSTRASLASAIVNGTVLRYSANTPRVGPNGLYAEGGATNITLQSETFDNATWTRPDPNLTVTADAVVAPDGQTTADAINENSVAVQPYRLSQPMAVTNGGTYVFSVFVKRAPASTQQYFIADCTTPGDMGGTWDMGTGLSTATLGGTPLTTQVLANGWYRIAFRYTAGATTSGCLLGFTTVSNNFTHAGLNGTAGYLWGAQLEAITDGTQPPAPSGYVPTTTTAVARQADVLAWTVPSGTFSTAEGCMRFCTTPIGGAIFGNAATVDTNNRIGYFGSATYRAGAPGGGVTVNSNEAAGQTRCYRTTWSVAGNFLKVENLTDGLSGSVAFVGFSAISPVDFGPFISINGNNPRVNFGFQFGAASTDCN